MGPGLSGERLRRQPRYRTRKLISLLTFRMKSNTPLARRLAQLQVAIEHVHYRYRLLARAPVRDAVGALELRVLEQRFRCTRWW